MQTIKITITSEKPTNLVLTEKKPEENKAKKKKSLNKKLETLLGLIPKEAVLVGVRQGDEQSCY